MFSNRPAMKSEETEKNQIKEMISSELENDLYLIRDGVQKLLLDDNKSKSMKPNQLRSTIEGYYLQILEENNFLYNHDTRKKMLDWVIAEILGYGPIEPLLSDQEITEVMVNGPKQVYAERFGLLEKTDVKFENNAHLMRIIDRIVSPIGRRVDETSPMVDARLPNGYRVNVTIPPLSLNGPILTIRKFSTKPLTIENLINNNTLTSSVASFLNYCVKGRVNLVVSGGTGSGKTTLLNILSSFIPEGERVITIEDTAELQLSQEHIVRLERRPPNIEGKGEISIRQLVVNALRMRPDRIVVGECRSDEAVDMLQAMNTGHDGSMTTIHSNSPRDALRRIETMVMMAGMDLPLKAIREQISSSIDLVIQMDRMQDGTRKVVKVTEVQNMEGDTIVMQDLFVFQHEGIENDMIKGVLKSTGLRPSFIDKLTTAKSQMLETIYNQ